MISVFHALFNLLFYYQTPRKASRSSSYYFRSTGIDFIDLPNTSEYHTTGWDAIERRYMRANNSPIRSETTHWLSRKSVVRQGVEYYGDEKDSKIKDKLLILVEQTLHDTENRIKQIQFLKDNNKDQPPYKIGFILSMIQKARDVMNELFNVAVKHREEWRALEQLKIFELIVHTNVDTTNLVRQLVEIHIQYLNTTSSKDDKKRVVLL